MIFSIFRFFGNLRFQIFKYCPNHTSMKILFIQLFQTMHKSEYPKTDPFLWLQGHIYVFVFILSNNFMLSVLWKALYESNISMIIIIMIWCCLCFCESTDIAVPANLVCGLHDVWIWYQINHFNFMVCINVKATCIDDICMNALFWFRVNKPV